VPKFKIVVLFFLLFTSFYLSAQAEITYLEGDVEILRNGSIIFADFGSEILEGDVIETGFDSLAIISVERYGEIKLQEESQFQINNFRNQFSGNLQAGGVFANVNPLGDRNFDIRANNATAGVRGTQFFMAFGRTIDEEPDIWLCVNEGSVAVSTERKQVLVNEGEGINILGGQDITDPRFYEWTLSLNWNTDPNSGDVKDDTDLDSLYSDLLDIDYD
jgi:hypothetical protein